MFQAQVSGQSKVFRPREYEVLAGLDVDHHSIAVTFSDHEGLLRSLRLPYSARQLLSYTRKHFLSSGWHLFMKQDPRGLDSTMSW